MLLRRVSLTLALTLAGVPAAAQTLRPWGDLSLNATVVGFLGSDYDQTLRVFDHQPLAVAGLTSAVATKTLAPWFALGLRFGWLATSSLAINPPTSSFSSSTMSFDVLDTGVVARFLATPEALVRGGARVHFDVEVGAAFGAVTMNAVAQRWVRPRIASALFVGYQALQPRLYVGARAGFQWLSWDGAGRSDGDPVFSGFNLGLEGGISL